MRGDHNTFNAGSMLVKFVQNNYNRVPGGWASADDDDYTEYEEVDARKTADPFIKEEPNYFQAGRFLKSVLCEDWFEEVRTHKRYTTNWRNEFVDALLESDYGWDIAKAWEDENRREALKGYLVGCLKDCNVISGAYDQIARLMGYGDDNYRSFSRSLERGRKKPFYSWIEEYVEGSKIEQ